MITQNKYEHHRTYYNRVFLKAQPETVCDIFHRKQRASQRDFPLSALSRKKQTKPPFIFWTCFLQNWHIYMNINILYIADKCVYMTQKINNYWIFYRNIKDLNVFNTLILPQGANSMMHLAEKFIKSKPRK